MDFPPILGGILGGVGANEAQRKIDKDIHGDIPDQHLLSKLHQAITELRMELKTITQHITDTRLPPIDEAIQLQVAPWFWTVHRKSRRYGLIFVPSSTTALTANIPQLGNVNFTPATGWTELNFPSGTQLFLASGNPTTIIYRCTNIPLGANVL